MSTIDFSLPASELAGLSAEQVDELVNVAESVLLAKAAEIRDRPCPVWCDRDPDRHLPGNAPLHMGNVGSDGVGMQRGGAEEPSVWVPTGDGESVPASVARQLAADLVAAADLLEEVSS